MRYRRALLAGLGWAGTVGGIALCVLIFLSAYLAFDDNPRGLESHEAKIVRLPALPQAAVSRVALARPSSRPGGGRTGAATRVVGRRAPAVAVVPRSRTTRPIATVPRHAPRAGGSPPVNTPPGRVPAPAPDPARPRPAPPSAGAQPAPPPTLGDTTSEVVGAAGKQVGRVSPPVGEAIQQTGDTVGDTVDGLVPLG